MIVIVNLKVLGSLSKSSEKNNEIRSWRMNENAFFNFFCEPSVYYAFERLQNMIFHVNVKEVSVT